MGTPKVCRQLIQVAALALGLALGCGIKAAPRAPSEQAAPAPVQSQPQTPMTLTPDAGCEGCAERGP